MSDRIQNAIPRSTLFGATVLMLLLATSPAWALTPVDPAAGCPQTLSAPGEYILTGDLDCSGTGGDGINITGSNVIFHLAGHTISSTDCDLTQNISGIAVPSGSSNVVIDGGTVSGFNEGILLYSQSSRVRGMKLTGACAFGAAISGQNNQLDTSVVTASRGDGIGIGSASGIVIVSNEISSNFRLGIDISNVSSNNLVAQNIIINNGIAAGQQGGIAIFNGTNNVIRDNTVNNNFDGILIGSPGNVVQGNSVSGSVGDGTSGIGIAIGTTDASTEVRGNTVLGSTALDMSDVNAACGSDVWTGNSFQTASVAGGPNPGLPNCIQ